MKLRLVGHDYKYAVEQIMLALFPGERPEYSSDLIFGSGELIAASSLSGGDFYVQATTQMRCGGKVSRGVARISREKLTGKLMTDRLLQRIVKQSFFKAAGAFTESAPVWGSLTGIRPAKLAAASIETGASVKAAAKMLTREYYVSAGRAEMCVDAAGAALDIKSSLSPGDVALYIGVPFCPTRCGYCSFVSNSVEKSFGLVSPFVETLLSEIDRTAVIAGRAGLRVISVYIGGGTPTALPDDALESVMLAVKNSFDLSHIREYTVEAGRPDTITGRKLDIAGKLGANRICVNPQSMSGQVLTAIGRRHTPEDVLSAVRMVRERAMALNMDIIAGLPRDDPSGFARSFDTVLELSPENLTVHTLSLKKGSRIMLEGTAIPNGAEVSEMLEYAMGRLRERGYSPYYLYRQKYTSGGFENTGWSLPGHGCIYNICMMEELCSVLALGGGGVTKLVCPGGRIERIFNAKYPREYIMKTDKLDAKLDSIGGHYAISL